MLDDNHRRKTGRIGIIDHDRVELSNIQRQVLHNEQTLGMYKALSASAAIEK
jgi:adenylyltransferase/sulfurtransferase